LTRTATDDLARLGDLEVQMRRLALERIRLIAEAQQHGASWEAISSVLGVSRQSAWETYRDRAREVMEATAARATVAEDEILESAGRVQKTVRARRRRT
jgi:hypothetical protein